MLMGFLFSAEPSKANAVFGATMLLCDPLCRVHLGIFGQLNRESLVRRYCSQCIDDVDLLVFKRVI
jgi:hypothetical protein